VSGTYCMVFLPFIILHYRHVPPNGFIRDGPNAPTCEGGGYCVYHGGREGSAYYVHSEH